VLDLLERADAVIEGFRPGVMERLGLGPDVVLARNPRLVYGRMTGWGQEGPLAQAPAMTSIISRSPARWRRFGTKRSRCRTLNLVGDFGGGALYLVVGVARSAIGSKTIRNGTGGRRRDVRWRGLADVMFFGTWRPWDAGREARESNFLDGGGAFLRRL